MDLLEILRDGVLKASYAVSSSLLRGNYTLPFDSMPSTMPSLRSIAKLALGSAQMAFLPSNNGVLGGYPMSCPNAQLSCHNTTAVANTCCFNAPGGQLLQTQFWDTAPATGPVDHWTIHGLW